MKRKGGRAMEFYCGYCGESLYLARGEEAQRYIGTGEWGPPTALLELKRHGLERRHEGRCKAALVYTREVTA